MPKLDSCHVPSPVVLLQALASIRTTLRVALTMPLAATGSIFHMAVSRSYVDILEWIVASEAVSRSISPQVMHVYIYIHIIFKTHKLNDLYIYIFIFYSFLQNYALY